LKVLTILNALSMGGAERMAFELIKNLDHDEFETPVLCYGGRLGTPLEDDMARVTDVDFAGIKGRITPLGFIKVMRKISNINPDIIHAHMGGVAFGIPWCFLHHKPIIVTVHTKPEAAFSRRNTKLIRRALKKNAIYIIAVSEENYKYVTSYFGVTSKQCGFVNNGIDLGRFYQARHEGFAYINVARQDENKNQAAIIRCFEKINKIDPDTSLYLIGEGPQHNKLMELVQEMGLVNAVILPGLTNNPEDYYAVSDVYVQSSHREALPLAVLEAMAAKLPIVATNVGGLRDIVKGNGKLIPDNDEDLLFDAMLSMKTEDSYARRMQSEMSYKIAQEYSAEKMAEKYAAIYRTRLGQSI